jgi:hypothetical protein
MIDVNLKKKDMHVFNYMRVYICRQSPVQLFKISHELNHLCCIYLLSVLYTCHTDEELPQLVL